MNAVEMAQEEATLMLLQLNMTYMSREGIFLNTSPPNERTFLIKDKHTLESMHPESTDVQANNIINHYKNRPHVFANYCLADLLPKYKLLMLKMKMLILR